MLAWLHPELAALEAPPWELAAPQADGAPAEVAAGGRSLHLLPLAGGAGAERAAARLRAGPAGGSPAPIPFFMALERAGDGASTRLSESWRGLLPGDRYTPATRAALHELIGRLHPARLALFRALEHFALAGFDLEAEARAGRFAEPSSTAPPARGARCARPRVVVVEGIDGAGKSTHVAALGAHLARRGVAAAAFKIFRHGVFHDTITDVTRRTAGERSLHLWRLQRMVKAYDSAKLLRSELAGRLAGLRVALFDRYLSTHLAAGTGGLHHDPYTLEILAGYPPADRTYLLDLGAGEALARILARGPLTVDENPYMLDRYRRRLLALARRGPFVVLDGTRPFEENQAAMQADLDLLLAEDAP